ncbi:MAG: RDD family protein [Ichthyobacteriaceae bacterium]|nr:RDD family protein [Ichthyobacteriaceae bacterium]
MDKKIKTVFVASKMKRFVAFLVDVMPITIIVMVFFINNTSFSVYTNEYLALVERGGDLSELNPAFFKYAQLINVVTYLIWGLYGAYAETTEWRGTFGKKLMKIQVGNVVGEPINGEIAFKRNVLKILTLSIVPILGIWVILDKKNRGIYDVFAKTLVVSYKK